MDAKMKEDEMLALMPQQWLCDNPELRCVLEGKHRGLNSVFIFLADATKQLLGNLFGVEHEVISYKWLRAIPKGENTGLHIDRAHLDGTGRVITVWMPIGDIPVSQGNGR